MKIRELLSDENRWTRGTSARDSFGHPVSPIDEGAVCWCVLGALCKCYPTEDDQHLIYDRMFEYVRRKDPALKVAKFNDQLGYDAVMELVNDLDL